MKKIPDDTAAPLSTLADGAGQRPILTARELTVAFDGQTIFEGLSFDVGAGVTLVRGGDGRGKSSLLRALAGALQADAGTLAIRGIGLRAQGAAYREQLYWIEPRSEAFDQITAMDYFESLRTQHAGFDDSGCAALVEGLSLTPHIKKPLYMLSTGSRRKVWFAGAVMSGAPVTLLDGPFASLDQASINFVLTILQEAAAQKDRAWLMSDYLAPEGLALSGLIDLGE